MRVEWISTSEEFDSLGKVWNELSSDVPFRRFEWLHSWWRHYGNIRRAGRQCQLLVLAVYDQRRAQPVGIAPLSVEHSWTGCRTVRFLGSGEVCSDYLSLLSQAGSETAVAAAVARWLNENSQQVWDMVDLSGVQRSDAPIATLVEHLWMYGHETQVSESNHCWRLALPNSWDEYLATLSKSFRKQVRRAVRKYLDTGEVQFRTVTDQSDLEGNFEEFVELHQRRRATLGQRGCFDSAAFTQFMTEAAARLLPAGALRLNQLQMHGQTIAVDFNVLGSGVLYAYQGGIDPTRLDMGPGNLLTLVTIRKAIDEGICYYDLLRGDEPYKAHWRAHQNKMMSVRVVRNALTARLHNGVWLARDRFQEFTKQTAQRLGGPASSGKLKAPGASKAQQPNSGVYPAAMQAASGDSGDLQVEVFDSEASLATLAEDWNRISGGNPMHRFEWYETWWRHFSRSGGRSRWDRNLLVLAVRDNDRRLVGLAPLFSESSLAGGNAIRFLASGAVCTDYQTIFCEQKHQAEVISTIGDWLIGHLDEWNLLELRSVDSRDSKIRDLAGRLRRHDCRIYANTITSCWHAALPGSWEKFLAKLSKSRRKALRRCERRYLDNGQVTIHFPQNAAELVKAFEVFRNLHQRRRESLGDDGCFGNRAFATFLEEICPRLFAAGCLDMPWAEFQNRPIACGLNFIGDRITYGYQSGIDPNFLEYSPGNLLTIARIRRAIERGHTTYDFLRGDEPYKKDWTAEPHALVDYRVVADRSLDRWRHNAWLGQQQTRRIGKRAFLSIRQAQAKTLQSFDSFTKKISSRWATGFGG